MSLLYIPSETDVFMFQGRELVPDDKIGITSGGGVSCLTLDSITADHAGKYVVSLENALGRDFKHASVAVEGKAGFLSSGVYS